MEEKITNFSSIKNKIKQCMAENNSKFVIFPFGENGMLTKRILNQCFGVKELLCVDNGYLFLMKR